MLVSCETWNLLIALLTSAGYKEIAARALIGRKLRDYAEKDVVEAFEAAAGKADPVAYASKILRMKGRKINGRGPQAALSTFGANTAEEEAAPAIQTEEGIRKGLEACKAVLTRRSDCA